MTILLIRLSFCAAFAALFVAAPGPALAAGWTSGASGSRAGTEAIVFSCEGAGSGRLRLAFPGFDSAVQAGLDYTIVVEVDGTAYRQTTRAANGPSGGRDLARTGAAGELKPLVEALAKGRKAEIASPTGRERVSLQGSGKALKALLARCF